MNVLALLWELLGNVYGVWSCVFLVLGCVGIMWVWCFHAIQPHDMKLHVVYVHLLLVFHDLYLLCAVWWRGWSGFRIWVVGCDCGL